MECLNELESKITHLCARGTDPGVFLCAKKAFQVARAQMHEQQPGLPIVAAKDIRPQDVMSFWGLQYSTRSDRVWQLELEERRGVPEALSKLPGSSKHLM